MGGGMQVHSLFGGGLWKSVGPVMGDLIRSIKRYEQMVRMEMIWSNGTNEWKWYE